MPTSSTSPARLKLADVLGRVAAVVALMFGAFAAYGVGDGGRKLTPFVMATGIIGAVALAVYSRTRLKRVRAGETAPALESVCAIAVWMAGLTMLALFHARFCAGLAAATLIGAQILVKWLAAEPALAGGSDGAEAAAPPHPVVDNLAGIFAALAAIVLSYNFALEAFRIPTGSMEPTLYGDPKWGDRAVVNKLAYVLDEPQRGDIIVLRYPLNRGVPYVKRLIGLPEELVLIAAGDVYIQGRNDAYPKIWRKEGALRESTWLPYYEFNGGDVALSAYFGRLSGRASASERDITLTPDGEKPALLRYPKDDTSSITDKNPTSDPGADGNYNREAVGDMRIRCTLPKGGDSAARLSFTVVRGATRITFYYDGYNGDVSMQGADADKPELLGHWTVEPDTLSCPRYDFVVSDGTIEVWKERKKVFTKTFETDVEKFLRTQSEAKTPVDAATPDGLARINRAAPNPNDCHIEIEARDKEVTLSNLTIERDIHYLGSLPYLREAHGNKTAEDGPTYPYARRIGPDAYFGLGDNTENSADSRMWNALTLTLDDGAAYTFQCETIREGSREICEAFNKHWYGRICAAVLKLPGADRVEAVQTDLLKAIRAGDFGSTLEMFDRYGVKRRIQSSQVKNLTLAHTPEIPRDLLAGQLLGSLFPKPRYVD